MNDDSPYHLPLSRISFYLCLFLHCISTFRYSLFPALSLSSGSVSLLSKMILWQALHIKPHTWDDPWSLSCQSLPTGVVTHCSSLWYGGYTCLTKIYLILNINLFKVILSIRRIFIRLNSLALVGLSNNTYMQVAIFSWKQLCNIFSARTRCCSKNWFNFISSLFPQISPSLKIYQMSQKKPKPKK